jgi:hypothetical protein
VKGHEPSLAVAVVLTAGGEGDHLPYSLEQPDAPPGPLARKSNGVLQVSGGSLGPKRSQAVCHVPMRMSRGQPAWTNRWRQPPEGNPAVFSPCTR